MFVVSVKSDKLKKVCAACLAVVIVAIGGIVYVTKNAAAPVSKVGATNMKAETNEERIAFFSQFSWVVNENPIEVKEVVIPEEFDETYTQYNELQKKQGLDLSDYKGVRVKMWSYEILNYPGYENSDGVIRGNILVYQGTVIGGDVCSVALDGFMTTFDGVTESIQ